MSVVPLLSPCSGELASLQEVPDQAFSQGMLGPGIAIRIKAESKNICKAPCSGQLQALMTHAFVIEITPSTSVLVHLGVDTYKSGEDSSQSEFSIIANEKQPVQAGQDIIEWTAAEDSWLMMTLLPAQGRTATWESLTNPGAHAQAEELIAQLVIPSGC